MNHATTFPEKWNHGVQVLNLNIRILILFSIQILEFRVYLFVFFPVSFFQLPHEFVPFCIESAQGSFLMFSQSIMG